MHQGSNRHNLVEKSVFDIMIITTKIFIEFLLRKFKNKNKKIQEKSKTIVNNTYIINVISNYAEKIEISNLNKNIKTNQEEPPCNSVISLLSY